MHNTELQKTQSEHEKQTQRASLLIANNSTKHPC